VKLKNASPTKAPLEADFLHTLLKDAIDKKIICIRSAKREVYKYVWKLREAGFNTLALDILLRVAKKCSEERRTACQPPKKTPNPNQKLREHAEMYEALDRTSWNLIKDLVSANDPEFNPIQALDVLGDIQDVPPEYQKGYMPNTRRILSILKEIQLRVNLLDKVLGPKLPVDIQYMIQKHVYKIDHLRASLRREFDGKTMWFTFARVSGLDGVQLPLTKSQHRKAKKNRGRALALIHQALAVRR
jgi:hypothetical protein